MNSVDLPEYSEGCRKAKRIVRNYARRHRVRPMGAHSNPSLFTGEKPKNETGIQWNDPDSAWPNLSLEILARGLTIPNIRSLGVNLTLSN